MTERANRSIVCIVTVFLLAACGENSTGPAAPGRIVLDVSYESETTAKPAEPQAVERMAVTVSRDGSAVVQQDLERQERRWWGEIEVDPGAYLVQLEAYRLLKVRWRGSAQVWVEAGKKTEASLQMISTNRPPVANAGPDQKVELGALVQLAGSGTDTDGDPLTYRWLAWRQTLGPTVVSQGDSAWLPFTPTQPGEYRFALAVSDGTTWSTPDEVVVTVVGQLNVLLPGGATVEFVWIEPGKVTMGSPSSELGRSSFADEGPQHQVTISRGFWLGKYEITQAQWEAVMDSQPWQGQDYVQANPSHPAVYISWNDVQELVRRLNTTAGEAVYRLPTEAEWEFACRAGTTTRWSFGDDEGQLGEYAWYDANAWMPGLQYAQPVGGKRPNPWGLFDMHGNVYEWVQDWYGVYSGSSQVDPKGPSFGSYRVIRGGDFVYVAAGTRSAYRNFNSPEARSYITGARLLMTR